MTPPPILIVDDQPKLLKLVGVLMNKLGFPEIDGVEGGGEALARLRERKYGLVIADLDMEPMDGIQLLREIRSDDALAHTPFILTETSFSFEDVNVAHLAGADAFILKPFDIQLLRVKLKQVLNGRPRRREAPPDPVSVLSADFPMLGRL